MIDALVAGRLHGAPEIKTSQKGKRYAAAHVRAFDGGGKVIRVYVVAFAESAINALLALKDGDSVALTGELTPKAYIGQHGDALPRLDLLAHAVLTEYHVERKREAMGAAFDEPPAAEEVPRG